MRVLLNAMECLLSSLRAAGVVPRLVNLARSPTFLPVHQLSAVECPLLEALHRVYFDDGNGNHDSESEFDQGQSAGNASSSLSSSSSSSSPLSSSSNKHPRVRLDVDGSVSLELTACAAHAHFQTAATGEEGHGGGGGGEDEEVDRFPWAIDAKAVEATKRESGRFDDEHTGHLVELVVSNLSPMG